MRRTTWKAFSVESLLMVCMFKIHLILFIKTYLSEETVKVFPFQARCPSPCDKIKAEIILTIITNSKSSFNTKLDFVQPLCSFIIEELCPLAIYNTYPTLIESLLMFAGVISLLRGRDGRDGANGRCLPIATVSIDKTKTANHLKISKQKIIDFLFLYKISTW